MNETPLNFPRLAWLTDGAFGGLTAAVAVLLSLSACGGADAGSSAKAPESARPEALQHEDCAESGNRVELLDTNGDGKPDIRRVFDKSSGHELCRIGDLNHDGKPEVYEYFDASGTVRRREFCYDDTGVVNAIEHYENGKLVRREYDAGGQHHIDTWDWFDATAALDPKTGRPVHPTRRERDTTGDGHVDQWWTWNGDKITIAVDSTGDGKPDPASTLVLGGSGAPADNGGAPPDSASAPSADGGTAAAAPTPSSTTSAASSAAPNATPNATSVDGGKP